MEDGDSDNDGGSSVKLVAAHSIEDARFVADGKSDSPSLCALRTIRTLSFSPLSKVTPI